MISLLTTLLGLLLCSLLAVASDNLRAGLALAPQQDAVTTTTGLLPFSSTVTYSYYSFTPIPQTDTTTFDSSMVVTSTVITVFASDFFHAAQSLLTSGDAVQRSANSSAALATRLPVSTTASTTTDTCTDSLSARTATPLSMLTTSTISALALSSSSSPAPSATQGSFQPQQGDAAILYALSWIKQYATIAIAAILANH